MFVHLMVLFLCLHYQVESRDGLEMDASNFGPYYIKIDDYKACKGPKPVDLTNYYANITKEGKSVTTFLNITFFSDTYLDEVRVYTYSIKNNVKEILWTQRRKSPCKNEPAAGIIQKFFNSTNCLIKKGTYSITLNSSDVSIFSIGPKFFYGTYFMKSLLLSKKGNILCSYATATFEKL